VCGQKQVLGRTTQACIQVMIVRINCRTASRQVWKNRDPSALQPEPPRLSVVAGCSQSRVSHQIRVIVTRGEIVVPPGLGDGLFIFLVLHFGAQRCGERRARATTRIAQAQLARPLHLELEAPWLRRIRNLRAFYREDAFGLQPLQ